jgi:hypothetical protein
MGYAGWTWRLGPLVVSLYRPLPWTLSACVGYCARELHLELGLGWVVLEVTLSWN